MGGTTSREVRSRSHRGGPELQLDVWAPQPTRENRSSRCCGSGRGVSPRDLSMRASSLVASAGGAVASECAARAAGRANSTDLGGPRGEAVALHPIDEACPKGAPGRIEHPGCSAQTFPIIVNVACGALNDLHAVAGDDIRQKRWR